jgi:hypothetical protein
MFLFVRIFLTALLATTTRIGATAGPASPSSSPSPGAPPPPLFVATAQQQLGAQMELASFAQMLKVGFCLLFCLRKKGNNMK